MNTFALRAINPITQLAISYASDGKPVFPCDPLSKAPLTPNGFKGATTDVNEIVRRWTRHPNAMIGMPTGLASGVWVLDIDVKTDGAAALARLEQENGALPPTKVVCTPSGGKHYHFKYEDGVRNRGSFEPGIDVRGEGGYVILPGSVRHDGKSYEWKNDAAPIADAPTWLLDKIKKEKPNFPPLPKARQTNSTYSEAAIADELSKLVGTSTNRNDQLNDSAFAIGQFVGAEEISPQEAERKLWGAAIACGYVDKDGEAATRATIRSGLDAGARQPRDIPVSDLDGLPEANPEWMEQWLAILKSKAKSRFQVTWFDDVNQSVVKQEILRGVLGVGETSYIAAKPGTAKSAVATDIGLHIAGDIEWHGRSVRQGLVVYFAAERKKLTERRVAAWRKKNNLSNIPFVVVGGKLDLTSNLNDARALAKVVAELENKCKQRCVLIILDTLTRTFGGADQHQSKDMARYIQSVDVLNRATSAHILIIHHSPWSEDRAKGAIDLDGAVDVSFGIGVSGTGPSKRYKLVCTGSNDGEEGDILTFKLESVTLGLDEEGNETTAPVVVAAEPMPKKQTHAEVALGCLQSALEEEGQVVPSNTPGFPDGVRVVLPKVWRQRFFDHFSGHEPTVKEQSLTRGFNRASSALVSDGTVQEIGQWVFISPQT